MRLSLQSLRKEMRYGAIEEEQISQNLVVATGKLEEAVGQKNKNKKKQKNKKTKKKPWALKLENLS